MKKIVSAALLALAMGGACAQAYVGGNFGFTHINADCSGYSSCDTKDTGYKLTGGYKLDQHFALEMSYIDFGKVTAKRFGVNYSVEVDAITLAGALRANFAPNLGGVVRLGVASVDSKGSSSGGPYYASDSQNKTKAYFGLGLEYAFNQRVKGLLEADFTNAERYGETASVRMFSAGVQYNF